MKASEFISDVISILEARGLLQDLAISPCAKGVPAITTPHLGSFALLRNKSLVYMVNRFSPNEVSSTIGDIMDAAISSAGRKPGSDTITEQTVWMLESDQLADLVINYVGKAGSA